MSGMTVSVNPSLRATLFAIIVGGVAPLVLADDDPSKREPFYVNNMTLFMDPEPDADKAEGVTPMSEGLWARKFPDGYQFYDRNGVKFTDSRWDLPGVSRTPAMTPDGMMVKKGDAPNGPYYLVKPGGSVVELPANWKFPTAFVDGLAIVDVGEKFKTDYKYVNKDLKIVFPHLSPVPSLFEGENNTIAPLSEELRAYCTKVDGYDRWGYIDRDGKIVIEPQFNEARSFHCGRALVKDSNGNRFFINPEGRKAYEPVWSNYDQVSDYDSNLCAAPGSRFDETDYYDLNGKKVATLKSGSAFHDGYAYCFVFHEDINRNLVHRVDRSFTVLGVVDVTSGDYNPPSYDALGLPHFNSWIADGAAHNGEYFFDYTVGPFSREGLAPATMVTNDGSTLYKGFIDKKGHFVLVYDKKVKK